MSYESLLAEAKHYSPAQEAGGSLIDSIGAMDYAASGTPTYQAAGPTSWLPFAVQCVKAAGDSFAATIPPDLIAVSAYTVALWVKRSAISSVQEAIVSDNATFFGLCTAADDAENLNGVANSVGPFADTNWHLFALGIDQVAVTQFMQLDTLRTEPATGTSTIAAGSMFVSAPGNLFGGSIAGVAWWSRSLLESEINTWALGPTVTSGIVVRKRGSGKIRKPGRR